MRQNEKRWKNPVPDFAVRTAFTATDRMSPAFSRMNKSAGMFSNTLKSGFATLGIVGGIGLLAAGFKKMVSSAMMIEDAQAAFTPLLGSVEKSIKLVDMLNIAAAETPFKFEDLSKVAKQLLPVMDGDLNNTIATMKMLGDTAGGNAEKLDSITRGYTKAMLKGKVDMESLNMIAEAGVPIHTELAKSMGYGKDRMGEFFKKVTSGTVTTKDLNNAFKKMTSEGGLFFQGMIIASKTTSGVMSTMEDNLTMVAAGIGTELLPAIKDFAIGISDSATEVLKFVKENKEGIRTVVNVLVELIKLLPYVIGGFIVWKAILKGVWLWQMAIMALNYVSNLSKVADMMIISGSAGNKYIIMLKQTAIWQKIVNFLLAANPIGLIVIAVGLLAYAIYDLYTNWEKYSLGFNIKIQDFITGFRAAKMEVMELGNALGLVSDKDLTGAKLSYLQSLTQGFKLKTQALQANNAPNATEAEGKYSSNTTVNINSNGTEAKAAISGNGQAKVNMNKPMGANI